MHSTFGQALKDQQPYVCGHRHRLQVKATDDGECQYYSKLHSTICVAMPSCSVSLPYVASYSYVGQKLLLS